MPQGFGCFLKNVDIFSFFPGQKPFQCNYCPYSTSQKGNLKTHVLCVHRMPFNNSQYPDHRFRRPQANTSEKNSDDATASVLSNK